jgi:hypothetical protein
MVQLIIALNYFISSGITNSTPGITVGTPWKLNQKQKIGMTEQEIREHHEVWGRSIWVSDTTMDLLYKIEPKGPERITSKSISNSWDRTLSKVLKYYADSFNGCNLEQIREQNKRKVDKIPELSFEESNKNQIHIWLKTWELLDHIDLNFFHTNPESKYYNRDYFGRNKDTVLQVILEYYIDKFRL